MVPAFTSAPALAFLPNVRQDPRRARSLFPAAWACCTPAGQHCKGWGLASWHPTHLGAAPSNTTQLPSCPPGRCRHHGAMAGSPSPLGHPGVSPAQQSRRPSPPRAAATSRPAKGFQRRASSSVGCSSASREAAVCAGCLSARNLVLTWEIECIWSGIH